MSHRLLTIAVLVALTFPSVVRAEDDPDREFEFASGLVELGFPDYAQKVAEAVVRLHPDLADRGNLIKAEGMIAARKFDDAEALLKSMGTNPKADAIRLALANGYYRFGEIDKAKTIYNEFFSKYTQSPTDPDLLRFYRDSAYRYSKMLEQAGDLAGAAQSLGKILATKPEKDVERSVMSERAQLLVREAQNAGGADRDKYLKEAAKLCDQIQWGGVDVQFGQSIITLANIEIVKGDKDKAMALLKDKTYADMFREIDKLLKDNNKPLSQSPMAGARFLLGQLYQDQGAALAKDSAKKDDAIEAFKQALTEYYNVFVKYGDSDWGPQAGSKAKEVEGQLKALGKDVKIDLGSQQEKAVMTQFNMADNLYRQKNYKDAIPEYLKTLNQFPETEVSPRALGILANAYAQLGDTIMVKVVVNYIGERFSKSQDGATALLALGKYYFDQKNAPLYMYVYEAFLKDYPKDERSGAILFTLAGFYRKEGGNDKASQLYERIIKDYPGDQYYPKALSQMAWIYYQNKDYAKALDGFRVYVRDTQPGPDQASAQFSLGDCLVRLDKHAAAAAEFEKLIGWLAPKDNPYSTTAADADKNRSLLERAAFERAVCYAKATDPSNSIPVYREKSVQGFDQFVTLFPTSSLAPKAMAGKGTVQLDLNQFDAAAKTFDALAEKYPKSEEGRSALFSLARSAMEIKHFDQAKAAFEKMQKNPGTYGAEQFVLLGQAMVDAGMNEQASEAFQQAEKMSDERAIVERSLYGTGRAEYALGHFDASTKALEDLLARYPKSGLFYSAKFLLGEAYRDENKLPEAQAALADVFKYSDDNVLINQASITLAEVQKKSGDSQAALASYQRVALLADPSKADLRPLIEQAIMGSIALANDLKRYGDVQDSCDQYLKLFPNSDKLEEVRKMKADAKLKASAATSPDAAAVPGAASP